MSEPSLQGVEDLIGSAKNAGWEWFERMDPKVAEKLHTGAGLKEADKREISAAWAAFAASPGGTKALQALFNETLNRTVFFTALGIDPGQAAAYGAFREGQNSVAFIIAKMIADGREAKKPKERDVT
jgi:hypothetical protein